MKKSTAVLVEVLVALALVAAIIVTVRGIVVRGQVLEPVSTSLLGRSR